MRLIDAESLSSMRFTHEMHDSEGRLYAPFDEVAEAIFNAPTIEAEPGLMRMSEHLFSQQKRSLNMRNNTVQQEEVRGMAVLDHVPEGWKVVGGCTNAPAGYRFINNNKSRFGGEYQHALVKEDVAIEWWINHT